MTTFSNHPNNVHLSDASRIAEAAAVDLAGAAASGGMAVASPSPF